MALTHFTKGARIRVRHVAGDGPIGTTTGDAFKRGLSSSPLMIQVRWPSGRCSWVPARKLDRIDDQETA